MHLPPLVENFAIKVTLATGSPIKVLGTARCPVTLGNEKYTHTFMVCQNIRRPMILGLDFLRKFRIVTNWTEEGEFQIQTPSHETIEAIKMSYNSRMKPMEMLQPKYVYSTNFVVSAL